MKTSESIKNIAGALVGVQANLTPAVMNSVNPYFKSKYADLNSVYESCRQLLADNGLSITQFPAAPPVEYGPAVALTTRLMHETGEWLEDTMIVPVAKPSPQDYGSALTYARRYAISAIIGIVTDEDDDANQAQGKKKDDYPTGKPLKSAPKKKTGSAADIIPREMDRKHDITGEVAREARTESIFRVDDEIMLHGKNDERPGVVTAVNGEMVTVTVDGKSLTVKADKLSLVGMTA